MDRRIDEDPPSHAPTSVARTPQEVELKLFVPPSSVAALWRHPLLLDHAGPAVSELESRYFDTPDGELAARRMALRLRRDGERWIQTLKVAAIDERALSRRDEWESVVGGPRLDLALLAGTPLAALGPALAKTLRPVFSTVFRRETKGVQIDGATVEVAFDRGQVIAGRGKSQRTLPISEIELEVKRGAPPDLLRFAAKLARQLPLIPLADSKAARGQRLLTRGRLEAVTVTLPIVTDGATAPSHLAQVLAAGNRTLLANVHALFEIDADQLEAQFDFIHQARIAVRRMRSALRLFEPVVHDRRTVALADRLQTLGRALGAARDQDVFATLTMERLERRVADDPDGLRALAELRTTSAARRIAAHRTLAAFIDTGEFGAITIAVERTIVRLTGAPSNKRDKPLRLLAEKWLKNQLKRIWPRARRIASLDDEERHRLRIEVKRLRYALDLFEGFYEPDGVKTYRAALAALQDKLGTINDAAVASALLHEWSAGSGLSPVAAAFAAWRSAKLNEQLPQVAKLAVALELTPAPWHPRGSARSPASRAEDTP